LFLIWGRTVGSGFGICAEAYKLGSVLLSGARSLGPGRYLNSDCNLPGQSKLPTRDWDGLRTEHRSILNTTSRVLLDDVPIMRIYSKFEMVLGFKRWDYISGLGMSARSWPFAILLSSPASTTFHIFSIHT
jgi:hypothetical protein